MSTFFKAKKQDPALLATVQRTVDAIAPLVQAELDRQRQTSLRTGRPGKPAAEVWNQVAKQQGVQLPDGYNVGPDGQVQYTNQTPWLQQAAWAATPIAAVSGAQAAFGGAAGGTTAGMVPSAGGLGMTAPNFVPASMYGVGLSGPALTTAQRLAQGASAAEQGMQGFDSAADMVRRTAPGGAQGFGEDMSTLEQVIRGMLGLVPAIGAAMTNTGPSAEEKALMAAAQAAQEQQMKRIQYQNPLFQAATQLAMSRLPIAQQRPLTGGFE